LFVPSASPLFGELPTRLVPELLGVEQDTVEIEDDGIDHE
jgi:hypothetical protein